MPAFVAAILSFLGSSLPALGRWIASRVTWRRVLVLGLFSVFVSAAGGLLFQIGQVFGGTFGTFFGSGEAIISTSQHTVLSDFFSGLFPSSALFCLYQFGADWLLWLCISIANFYVLQLVGRRAARWIVAVVGAIYHNA